MLDRLRFEARLVGVDEEARQAFVRERDTLAQERVPIAEVAQLIEERVSAPWSTPKLMS